MNRITKEILAREISDFLIHTLPQRSLNEDYYNSRQAVNKGKTVYGRPDNILRANVCKYITDVHTGYFMGVPATFDFEDASAGEKIRKVLKGSYFDELMFSLARDMSIYGTAYCLAYRKEGKVRCIRQSPLKAFIIYDKDIDCKAMGAVRICSEENGELKGEIYEKGLVRQFSYKDRRVQIGESLPMPENVLSIVEFPNNIDKIGDFTPILSLMDAYNVLLSGAMDDMQSVANAFLALYGMQGTTKEDIEEANRSRVLSLSESGRAEFVVKNVNPQAIDSLKKTILDNMLLVTMTPNLTDDSFGQNTSGIAIEYKLWGIEQSRSEKQRSFSRSMMALLQLICSLIGLECDISGIVKLRFYKNLPQDTLRICETIDKLQNLVSHKTKLELLPFIEDADKELEKVKAES